MINPRSGGVTPGLRYRRSGFGPILTCPVSAVYQAPSGLWLVLPLMTRLVLNALAFSLVLATTAIAQVKITIPAHRYKAHDEIHAKLENTDKSGHFLR